MNARSLVHSLPKPVSEKQDVSLKTFTFSPICTTVSQSLGQLTRLIIPGPAHEDLGALPLIPGPSRCTLALQDFVYFLPLLPGLSLQFLF